MKMRLIFLGLAGLAIGLWGLPAGALRAQSLPVRCQGISGENEPANSDVTGCLKPVIDYHSLITVSDAVRNVIAAHLAQGASIVPEPAGLRLDRPEDVWARLADDGTVGIEPVADVPVAVSEQRLWNSWFDGKYSWIEGKDGLDDSKGPLGNVMIGTDYRLSKSAVLGLVATYETSSLKTGGLLPIRQNTEGFGGGAYLGLTLTPNVIFSGLATYAAIDTDLDLAAAGSTDSDRVQLSGAFTGYWYFGTTRLSPSLTLAWSKEWPDDYAGGINPAQTFETGVLSGGGVLGHTFALTDQASVEPFAGAFIDYAFLNETRTDGLATKSSNEEADLRLQLGLNLTLAANAQLVLTGETSGILLDDSDT